jgi:hypothetical protein
MRDIDEQVAVKQGQWFYGGLTTCPVRIVHHPTRLGSHDPEDPPELAADTQAGCFYIRYRPPGPHSQWKGGGMAGSLREAMFLAQRKLGPVLQWED